MWGGVAPRRVRHRCAMRKGESSRRAQCARDRRKRRLRLQADGADERPSACDSECAKRHENARELFRAFVRIGVCATPFLTALRLFSLRPRGFPAAEQVPDQTHRELHDRERREEREEDQLQEPRERRTARRRRRGVARRRGFVFVAENARSCASAGSGGPRLDVLLVHPLLRHALRGDRAELLELDLVGGAETEAPPAPSGEKARDVKGLETRDAVSFLTRDSAAERVSAAPDMRAASRGSSHCVSAFTGSGVAARMVTPAGEEGVSFFLITLPAPSAMSSAFTSRAAFFAADASTGLFTGAGIADFFTAFAPSFPSAGVSGFFFAAAFRGGGDSPPSPPPPPPPPPPRAS